MRYAADRTTHRNIVIALIILVIVGYAFFQARKVISGPQVEFLFPSDGDTFDKNLVDIKGKTKNINSITFNDGPIFIDDKGLFSEKFLMSPGYNIVEVEASDRFGKHIRKTLQLVYVPQVVATSSSSEIRTATSSPTTTNSQ
jgi:hypothetical protein